MAPRKKTESKVVKKKEYALDLPSTLRALDIRDLDYYSRLKEEQKKEFYPVVLMRFMSVVENRIFAEHSISTVNSFVNLGFWDLKDHPELQWKLLASCGIGSIQRHNWISGSKRVTTTKLDNLLLQFNPGLNDSELDLVKSKLTKESLKELCKDYGMDESEYKPIIEDLKKISD